MKYSLLSASQINEELEIQRSRYEQFKSLGLKLNMSRGCPCDEQLKLSEPMITENLFEDGFRSQSGSDIRNYGEPTGLIELKEIFAPLLDTKPENMFIGGTSSLNLMYSVIADAMILGFPESDKPWGKYEKIKFICPCPGYDRHFRICEVMGIEMIPVKMLHDGPDMDEVERLISEDDSIKGIWCVPKYSNPLGITFDPTVVRRIAALKPKAKDFKVFWDNAYCIHDLYEESDTLLNIFDEAKKYDNEDMIFMFASTSKITLAGGGISFIVASDNNIELIKKRFSAQTICYDKLNQIRHVRFLKNPENVRAIMSRHASIIRPKFELVFKVLGKNLGDSGIAEWTEPNGGYFVSLDLMDGTARRTWQLAYDAGVQLTQVGATFPYGKDPLDKNIRVAPTFPNMEQLELALEVLCVCAKIAALEKLSK